MALWVVLSLAAAALQTIRYVLQKKLSITELTAEGTTLARFLYSAPLVGSAVLVWWAWPDTVMPPLQPRFFVWCVIGGGAQIIATIALVRLFQERAFAAGICFAKIETLHAAVLGFVFLGDRLSTLAALAIGLGLVGVVLLSLRPGQAALSFFSRATALGLAAGLLFGVAGVAMRGATLAVEADSSFLRAVLTLAIVTSFQLAAMLVWMRLRRSDQPRKVLVAWRSAGMIGLFSLAGSLSWFWAFALAPAAQVKLVGQTELLFSLLASYLLFGERISRREYFAMALIAAAIMAFVVQR